MSPSDICFLVDKYTNNDANIQLSQYVISRQNKIFELFEKSYLVKQADNKKNKKFELMQLPSM